MRLTQRPNSWIAGGALLLLLLLHVSCTTAQRHEWLTFFVDGVPPEGGPAPVATKPTPPPAPVPAPARPPSARPVSFVHAPYRDRECRVCHTSDRSEKIAGPLKTICFNCHDDFLSGARFTHDPAREGSCTACHLPHRSSLKKLLIREGDALCLDCHDQAEVRASASHADAGARRCLDCHAPHASDRKGLLK